MPSTKVIDSGQAAQLLVVGNGFTQSFCIVRWLLYNLHHDAMGRQARFLQQFAEKAVGTVAS